MQINETTKNQVFVIEKSGKAVHLGGCGNPNQAVQLVNAALKAGEIKNPHFTLIVPNNKVMPCVPETTLHLVRIVKSASTSSANLPGRSRASVYAAIDTERI